MARCQVANGLAEGDGKFGGFKTSLVIALVFGLKYLVLHLWTTMPCICGSYR